MPKSEVLIEMPEFEKKYNLAMVDTEKVTSRVRPKQFLHIDEAECILCCLLYTSPSPRDISGSRMPSSA